MQEYNKSIKYSFLCKLEYFNKHTNKVIPMQLCNVMQKKIYCMIQKKKNEQISNSRITILRYQTREIYNQKKGWISYPF